MCTQYVRCVPTHPPLSSPCARVCWACAELKLLDSERTAQRASVAAWESVSEASLKKSDPKFKCYLGLCSDAAAPPEDHSHAPPTLEVKLARQTWQMPQRAGGSKDFQLASSVPDSQGPWWAGFGPAALQAEAESGRAVGRRFSRLDPHSVPITSEPVPAQPTQGLTPGAASPFSNAAGLCDRLADGLHRCMPTATRN